ncbi:MAG: M14 family zinc carboxypeptidase [Acidimicrobiia bacterium]
MPADDITVPLDRFVKFPELTQIVQGLAAAYPSLLELSSIGQSQEGREIWLCTLTNTATGPAQEKPAIWIDANIHATELTGSVAALNLIARLVREHGSDPTVTRALDTRTFYVVPRLGPDGAELAMAERPRYVRSSVRSTPASTSRTDSSRRTWTATAASCRCASRTPTAHGSAAPLTRGSSSLASRPSSKVGPSTASSPRVRSRTTTA